MKVAAGFGYIFNLLFGTFERQELKKFIRMGVIFSCIIGSFWTIGTLRNALFVSYVGLSHLPFAKAFSLFLLVPAIIMYTKLLDWYGREKLFYAASLCAMTTTLILAGFFYTIQLAEDITSSETLFYGSIAAGYFFYFFVELYGLLMPSLFWAIASDITLPDSALKGFPLIVALGQVGGILGPYTINFLIPHYANFQTSIVSFVIVAGIMGLLYFLMKHFFAHTPPSLLVSYHGVNERAQEEKQKVSFFQGIKLLFAHSYLMGIAAIIIFPEFITTIFDMHFHSLAATQYTGKQLIEYFAAHGSTVNTMTLLFLLTGISNITRMLGVGVALFLMPLVYAAEVIGFITLDSLPFLFFLMAISKAINYSLNGPAIKQLYIPTTHAVRFKARAWMETFGSRGAREVGSVFNMYLAPLQHTLGEVAGRAQHALYASYISFFIVVVWFFVALFLGNVYTKTVKDKKVVC